jgi:membrane protein YdbS with pleckstrin-like domain
MGLAPKSIIIVVFIIIVLIPVSSLWKLPEFLRFEMISFDDCEIDLETRMAPPKFWF